MAATAFAALVLAACDTADQAPEQDVAEHEGDSEFFDDPASLVGETVTVLAVVDEVVDPRAFRMAMEDANGDEFLVIHDGSAELEDEVSVEVSGTVTEFNEATIEEDYGVDLDREDFEQPEGEYGIVADSVDPSVE